jgi:hypothetical protein
LHHRRTAPALHREWIGLEHWGYDLRLPGTYTMVGFYPYSRDSSLTASAQLKFTLVP